jgi:dipicolinate synthase subunit A
LTSPNLTGKKVAVVGGDDRMLEIMRQARSAGAEVVSFACAEGAELASDATPTSTLAEAVKGAHIVICPVPALGTDGSLWTPNYDKPVFLTAEDLSGADPSCVIFMGRVSPEIQAVVSQAQIRAIAHGDDDAEALLHAIPTAEGAIRHAIDMSAVTIMGSKCVCTGFGRVGQSVAWLLRGMGADVTLCARNPSQLARATGFGLRALPLEQLSREIGSADFIFQSAPGLNGYVLTEEILRSVPSDAVLIELSSPPSGTDLEACRQLGINALWARGQAGSAPKTAGRTEWEVIMRLYREESGHD